MLTSASGPDGTHAGEGLGWRERAVRLAVPLLLTAGAVFLACWTNAFYPIRHWLIFEYAGAWLVAAVFSLSSLAAGWRLFAFALPVPRLGERAVLAFALGVLVFFYGVFIAGLLGLFGRVFFFAWPAALLAYGVPRAWRDLRRIAPRLRRFGVALLLPRRGTELLGAVLLLLGTLAVYLHVMNPKNLGADAHGYHIPIAEHYVAAGAIRAFADGWYLGAYPQLSSILYAWALLAPGDFSFRTMICSHLEWALFLATLPSVSVLTGRLIGRRAPLAAAVVYLFPGLFLYDSNLTTGADHVLAFWMAPVALALVRLGREHTRRSAVLVAAMVSAAVLTKYQGSYAFVVAGLAVVLLAAYRRDLHPLVAFAATGLVVTSAHWLKNLVFYGDPLYPLLFSVFPTHPFHPGAERLFNRVFFIPWFSVHGTPLEKLGKTLEILVSFSFVPHNWESEYGLKPVFGSLFTLLLPVLPLLRPRRPLWLLVLGTEVAVLVWFRTSAQDRFLQALVPWMAACTAAMLALAWQKGALARGGAALLAGTQVLWGSDVYFYRSHAMIGDNPLKVLVDRLGAGQEHKYAERDRPVEDLMELGKQLPPGAKLLLHNLGGKLGLCTESLNDEPGWQGATDYAELDTPAAVRALWRKFGATHVAWHEDRGATSAEDLGRESVFARALREYANEHPGSASGRRFSLVAEGPQNETLARAATRIAWLGCGGDPPMGIYAPRGLAEKSRHPETGLARVAIEREPLAALADANALVLRPSCHGLGGVQSAISPEWAPATSAGDVHVWVRKKLRE